MKSELLLLLLVRTFILDIYQSNHFEFKIGAAKVSRELLPKLKIHHN